MKKISIILILVILLLILFGVYSYLKNLTFMGVDPSPECDLDIDLDCDDADFELFKTRLGECVGGGNFQEKADVNHDGCITLDDQINLFPSKTTRDDKTEVEPKIGSFCISVNDCLEIFCPNFPCPTYNKCIENKCVCERNLGEFCA